ncbi:MAG: hypothetical protein E7362_05180 [Clostridiales bacterium]|nr:hypothetical protein [Clostridiales bacterium]
MEIIQKVSDITNLKYNQVISSGEIELVNTKINFNGTNNLIFIHNPSNVKVQIVNTDVTFYGNNNLLFIDAGKFKYTFSLHMYHNSVCHIGANNYFNPYGEILRLRCA